METLCHRSGGYLMGCNHGAPGLNPQ